VHTLPNASLPQLPAAAAEASHKRRRESTSSVEVSPDLLGSTRAIVALNKEKDQRRKEKKARKAAKKTAAAAAAHAQGEASEASGHHLHFDS